MLKGLLEKLKKLTIEPVPYDPSQLGDEIAMRTEWGPAKGGGASFKTHRLVHTGPRRAEFRATGGAIAFYLAFGLIGLGVALGFTIGAVISLASGSLSALAMIFPILIGVVFAAIGGGLWWFGAAPIVFDKQYGEYWKGRVAPHEAGNRHTIKEHLKLDRIHALQLLAEHCRGKDSSYYSYELNLVLDDGTRTNVVDHGNQEELRNDAAELAKFLGRPLWDATA